MPVRRIWTLSVVVGCALVCSGCGSSADSAAAQTDREAVVGTIQGVADAVTSPERLRSLFVASAVPSKTDQSRYAKYSYEASGDPSVSGSTARIKVVVRSARGEELGTVDWTLTKDGDRWKIQSAPLPN